MGTKLHIEEWAQGRTILQASLAIFFCRPAEFLFEMLNYVRNKEKPFFLEYPSHSSDWFDNYYHSKRNSKKFFSLVSQIDEHAKIQTEGADLLLSREGREQLREQHRERTKAEIEERQRKIFEAMINDIKNEISGNIESVNKEGVMTFAYDPGFLFQMLVVLPCIHYYQEHPVSLFRKARQGKRDALEKLLRVDKAIICDRRISAHFYKAIAAGKSHDFDCLATSLLRTPGNKKISRRRCKCYIAAFVSVLSEKLNCRLSSGDIQSLFDAFARDFKPVELRDTDLPWKPEAFAKAILRDRPTFLPMFKPAVKAS